MDNRPYLQAINARLEARWHAGWRYPRSPGADTQTLAFTLIGAVHHLVLTNPAGLPDLPQQVARIVAALTAGLGPAPG
jgi:hypothetical protein